jgi:hypothetical protein
LIALLLPYRPKCRQPISATDMLGASNESGDAHFSSEED